MWVKYEITKDSFLNEIWGEAKQTVENLIDEGISSEQIFDYYEEMYSNNEENPVDITDINDDLAYNADAIYQFFGVDPYGELTSSKKVINGKVIESGADTGNYTVEFADELSEVLDRIENSNSNIHCGFNMDATHFFIDVTQDNETTGNSSTWSFSVDFTDNHVYEVDPYYNDLGPFENMSQVESKIKRTLNGDTSTRKY